jgi:hypothetical protein
MDDQSCTLKVYGEDFLTVQTVGAMELAHSLSKTIWSGSDQFFLS